MDRNDVQTSYGYIFATFSLCLSNLKLPLSYHSTLKVAKTLLDIISIHFNNKTKTKQKNYNFGPRFGPGPTRGSGRSGPGRAGPGRVGPVGLRAWKNRPESQA